ncbi:HAMP domain-containing protein [Paraburkholderia aromaticivorans]|uniref:HAMP domain-containing protein n=1 Tax=Paraburkholderia aromaticivorans TaxID=2026199 RepID=UPI001F0F41A5|nr:HAMP domain-containing protein [Paraburkholderia aromaticivorans]
MAAERLKKDIDTYERLHLPCEDRQYSENDKKTIAAFLVVYDELYNLATSDIPDLDAERVPSSNKSFALFKIAGEALSAQSDAIFTNDDGSGVIRLLMLTFSVMLIAVLVAIYICTAVATSITHPLNVAAKIAEAVAAGDLTSQVTAYTHTELDLLMRALRN